MYSDLYKEMKWKINLMGVLIFFCFFFLFLRILYIQLVKGVDYKNFLKKQIVKKEEVRNLRGSIYDRNGEILAFSLFKNSYFCLPQKIKNLDDVTKFVTKKLNISEHKFNKLLKQNKGFFWIKRQDSAVFKKQEIPLGIEFIKEEKRVYPNDNLASHIIGYAGVDNKGLSGIEYKFDDKLRGSSISIIQEKDAKGRILSSNKIFMFENNKSQNIYLTIDKTIQHIVEKYIDELIQISEAKSAAVIIQDIKTGEILAMANRPDFNGNNFLAQDTKILKNSAVSNIYEPGSTVKVLVVGAAIEEKIYDIKDKIYCELGKFKVFDHVIKDHDKKYKDISLEDILVYSSNIGMAKIGKALGKNTLYKYFQKLGFGVYTGIELPGEVEGLLKNPLYWYDISPYIMAFGQGFAVTPIQLINTFSAVANTGIMMEPYILKKIENGDNFEYRQVRKVRRIFSKETCKDLMRSMELVVEKGTAKDAEVLGYKVAGKTGTAQKYDKKIGTYSDDNFVASFAGIFPADSPKVSTLVIADSPKGIYWGGDVCGPVFSKIARDLAIYWRILPTEEI